MIYQKASNAVVSSVDFFATIVGELERGIEQQNAAIQGMGTQLKEASDKLAALKEAAKAVLENGNDETRAALKALVDG